MGIRLCGYAVLLVDNKTLLYFIEQLLGDERCMNSFIPIAAPSWVLKMAVVERVAEDELNITESYLLTAWCLVVSASEPPIGFSCRPTIVGNFFE